MSALPHITHKQSMGYGLLALPLAFVALPMYVNLPHFYATQFAVPLTSLGAVLLFSRLIDALVDPMLGRLSDALYLRSSVSVLGAALAYAIGLLLSFAALFFPPTFTDPFDYVIWVGVWVTLCHLSYSGISILHQAWASRLGGGASQQSRVVAWREGAGLVGVVIASALPVMAGWLSTTAFLGLMLFMGLVVWSRVLGCHVAFVFRRVLFVRCAFLALVAQTCACAWFSQVVVDWYGFGHHELWQRCFFRPWRRNRFFGDLLGVGHRLGRRLGGACCFAEPRD